MASDLKVKSLGGSTCAEMKLHNFTIRLSHGHETKEGTIFASFAPSVLSLHVPSHEPWIVELGPGSLQALWDGQWEAAQISSGQEFQPIGPEAIVLPGSKNFSLRLQAASGQIAQVSGHVCRGPSHA